MKRTALSGRSYHNVPENIDINEWDAMTIVERMEYKNMIEYKSLNLNIMKTRIKSETFGSIAAGLLLLAIFTIGLLLFA